MCARLPQIHAITPFFHGFFCRSSTLSNFRRIKQTKRKMSLSEGGIDGNGTVTAATLLKRFRKLEGLVSRLSKNVNAQHLALDDMNESVIFSFLSLLQNM